MGLLDWITESAKAQYAKGEPYRQAIGGLLQGDATKLGLLAQDFNRRAQTPEGALEVALNFAPFGITAYHASPTIFDQFDIKKIGSTTDSGYLGHGGYFSTDPNIARNTPEKNTLKFDINYKNPLKLSFPSWEANKKDIILNELNLPKTSSSLDISKELKKRGYDSVELDYSPVGYNQKEIMMLNPETAKRIK